ncbi:sodium/potassium/calcium exchanger 2-like isoform X1 [Onychostoma macrolepis]|uniref:sodium/potassium/calcium exchanger 2-like isoform X1 n=1 Tax=Onychostoma macrolepis TaxID=369639 RepID=UPI00272D34BA|nr:sodium/potassium/calcium exchanger 2-like isoform X1 [Onychostoma macrolepis]XP_058630684.1 sodium/potassium/calcium exchanger 2-like isoform X1 [Onychostoma macrolepis]XP_058630691.1 sodium/potassium/calcium exchanger 2-like isoform X1 [Onychostoma macrolepis]
MDGSDCTPLQRNSKRHRVHHVRRKLRPSRIFGFILSISALTLFLSWSAFTFTLGPFPRWMPLTSPTNHEELAEPVPHRTVLSSDEERNVSADMPIAMASSDEHKGDYPEDLFTLEERRQGAVGLHMLGMLYMFIALAIVCDEFFVPALTVITEKLEISDDVAGATFMAAGGSAPELFTSVIGVFISHSNVGIGTIVGSAVFNILFVIGMCALFSREILNLTWWPLFRDVSFYIIGLIMLIVFFLDNYITYVESIGLLLCYVSYVTFMKYNVTVETLIKTKLLRNQVDDIEAPPKVISAGDDENKLSAKPRLQRGGSSASLHNTLMRNSIFQLMIHTLDPLSEDILGKFKEKASILHKIARKKGEDEANGVVDKNLPNSTNVEVEVTPPMNGSAGPEAEEEEEDEDQPLSLAWPDTPRKQVTYLLIFPIVFPLWLSLPDVRRDTSKKFFPITFLGSISWIAVFSYLMVWWAHQVGETIGITEEIMGLTILAAGTSIPDLITSVIVARKGLGDMAVSSSVGSNIFDITVGLPFPWLLFSIVNDMTPVTVSSNGLFCAIVLLFLMLLFVIISIAVCKWKMSKLLGFFMFLLYFVFLVVSVMLEDKFIICPVSI